MRRQSFTERARQFGDDALQFLRSPRRRRQLTRILAGAISLLIVLMLILMFWWSRQPAPFDPQARAEIFAHKQQHQVVSGYVMINTVKTLTETLLSKSGGYLSNDVMPPSVWMDNMPNWEQGVLTQIRQMLPILQITSEADGITQNALQAAQEAFQFNAYSWLFPPAEHELRRGIRTLEHLQSELTSPDTDHIFHNDIAVLQAWLTLIETELDSLSLTLASSVKQQVVITDITPQPAIDGEYTSGVLEATRTVKTPRTKIDNVFYQARGTSWALIHLLQAVEIDFADVLREQKALPHLHQALFELENTQATIWSPILLNGSGFGLFANHSLIMASHIYRAQQSIARLQKMLDTADSL